MKTQKKEVYNFQSETKKLLHLMIHSLYSNKEIFLRELISNSSDAIDKLRFESISSPELYENDSDVKIQISINKAQRTLIISDNGIGMTKEDTIENLGTIAKSGTKSFLQEGEYNITNIVKKTRGTEITLFLKKEEEEFLETWRIKNIISKYSDHITIPIHIQDYDKKNKTYFWEQINKAKALWTLNKSSITEEEYKDFYKHLTNDQNDPLIWSHNHVEGNQEYISLLYIPEKAAWDIWNRDNKHGLKLYVKRVYIMDNSQAFLPNYLRFIKGLIDSSDLPLNISREILQDNSITEKLRKSLIKKSLSMLEKLAQKNNEKYQIFWKNEQQEKIYYITADSYSSANNSPHLELFKKNNIDVLLLSDRIDEWMMNYLSEFEGKKFQSISKEDISLNKLTKEKKIKNKDVSTEMIEFLKKVKNILGNQVKDVRLTHRLTETPCVLLSDSTEMTTQMAKLFSAAGQSVPELKYIFEINPDHILIKKICTINNENELHQWIKLLLDQALLAEKGNLENPHKFISRMNKLLIK
nr:MAG: molecular chaperone HtpG [Erwiniaceae bacterium 4572_131]